MEYLTLNNGVKIPQLGFGVYQVEKYIANLHDVDLVKRLNALKVH